MSVYCIEDFGVKFDCPQQEPTGRYEITKKGTMRPITVSVSYLATEGAGEIRKDKWHQWLMKMVEVSGQLQLLEKIKEHCKAGCAWLRTEEAIEDYSLQILAGRIYAIGRLAWKDFPMNEVTEGQAFLFDFKKGW